MTKPLNPSDDSPRPRVLLVDDEQSILAALRRLLRREGYEIYTAESGAEALEIFDAQGPFDLVMSDFRMPGMTGAELLRQVRDRSPDALRIVLSGYSEVHALIDAINDGAIYKYLTKPWNDEELKLNLRRAIEQRALERANSDLVQEIAQQNEKLRVLNAELDQRANDANLGLSFTQELMEFIHAGVLCIDPHGVVVGANSRMSEMLPGDQAEVIGMPADEVLPEAICSIVPDVLARTGLSSGRVELSGRGLQWSCKPFEYGQEVRGQVITFWEAPS